MTLLALDVATRTGVALCEPFSGKPRMRLLSWQMPEKQPIQEKTEVFTDFLVHLIGEEKIEYAAVEIPQAGLGTKEEIVETKMGFEKRIKPQGHIQSQMILWGLHCSAVTVLHALKVPYRAVGVKEWRKAVFGNGNMKGKDSKLKCKELMHRLDIHCPNTDSAEAGGIMFYLNGHYRRWLVEDRLERESMR